MMNNQGKYYDNIAVGFANMSSNCLPVMGGGYSTNRASRCRSVVFDPSAFETRAYPMSIFYP